MSGIPNLSMIPNLSIDHCIDSDNKTLTLSLMGYLDATAGEVLKTLPEVPVNHKVVLDFERVDKVNSMGLAQLMHCLEHWKTENVITEVINLNSMVSMLFKMTGLNRYFGANNAQSGGGASTSGVASSGGRGGSSQFRRVKRTRPQESNSKEQRAEISARPRSLELAAKPVVDIDSKDKKMTFSVSLQNNQALTGWYFLNTLLQRQLDRTISMNMKAVGRNIALHENAIVFAKPFDACSLVMSHNYIPIARPANDNVEISVVVHRDAKDKSITDFTGASVATTVKESFVFLLGRFLCDEYGLESSSLACQFTGNESTAVRRVLEKDVDMLFILQENYQLLPESTRDELHVLEESETGMASYMLLLSPEFADLQSQLTNAFLTMQDSAEGQKVLKDLGVESWFEPEQDEIMMLQMLYGRYAT